MPGIEVTYYMEDDGSVPSEEWLCSLPEAVQDKFAVRIEELEKDGHDVLRTNRNHAAHLRDQIYELRTCLGTAQFRLLFFFHGQGEAVLSHGFQKLGARVPPPEIDRALDRKAEFEADADAHRPPDP
jgi:phage-related protein